MKKLLRKFSSLYTPERNSEFSCLQTAHLNFFDSVLPSSSIVTKDLDKYNTDYIGTFKGESNLVLMPFNTEQVQAIVKYCNQENLPLSLQSGNTGLVGGSVPVHDEVILNLSNLKNILDFFPHEGLVKCEAGVILEKLNKYCEERGYLVPLDLGAKGSCMVGGNIATNAGGNRLIRYGSLHNSVVGLEVVTGTGEVFSSLSRTGHTGFDLGQVFIGSEGTLGIITKAALKLSLKPLAVNAALLGCSSFSEVLKTLKLARNYLGEVLSAFEFLDSQAFNLSKSCLPKYKDIGFSKSYKFYVLVETSGSNYDHDYCKFEKFLETALESSVEDGILASDIKQLNALWTIRENCGPAAARAGHVFFS